MVVLAVIAVELLCVYVLGRRLLDGLVGDAIRAGRPRRWATWALLAPGVTLHEASHAAVATALLGKVTRFVPFSPTPMRDGGVLLGEVRWHPSRIPVLGGAVGRAAVGLAPLVLVPALVYAAGCALVPGVALGDAPHELPRALAERPVDVGAVLWAFVALSAAIGLLPSKVDHQDLPRALVVLALAAGLWLLWRGGIDSADGQRLLTDTAAPATFLAELLAVPAVVALVGGVLQRR
ncbi:hypothetical protein [Patulibacter minatonensis]|uniref:hypothetical protein n=1 Tax=Patulibacter minatonensis TaxID=298163 RepID=UPI00047AF7A0|nr:hypothetical protein [Patulibacter minatonensis]